MTFGNRNFTRISFRASDSIKDRGEMQMLRCHDFTQHAGFEPRFQADVTQGSSSEAFIRVAEIPHFLLSGVHHRMQVGISSSYE